MNRADIERMARAAKGHAYTNRYTPGETAFAFSIDRLENFVSMVRAAEREACAKVCEGIARDELGMTNLREYGECARAIRARGRA